jgi:hypothetical protein
LDGDWGGKYTTLRLIENIFYGKLTRPSTPCRKILKCRRLAIDKKQEKDGKKGFSPVAWAGRDCHHRKAPPLSENTVIFGPLNTDYGI